MYSVNELKNKPIKLSVIASLILFTFPFANQSIAAQIEANAGEIINIDNFTYEDGSHYTRKIGLLSDGVGAEINVTGTGNFDLIGNQSSLVVKNGGAINLTGGGTINSSGGTGAAPVASVIGPGSKLTMKDYQISVDASVPSSSRGSGILKLENTLADNQISNTTITYTGNDKAALLSVAGSNVTLNNNHFTADHAKGGAVKIMGALTSGGKNQTSIVNINGGYYESSNSVDGVITNDPLLGATIDLGGGSTLNLTNNVQVVSSDDSSAIQLRYGTLNAENATIQGGKAGIMASISEGEANLSNTTISASQGAAILVDTTDIYSPTNIRPSVDLNAINSSLSGQHGIRIKNAGTISGTLDNTSIDAIETAVSVDSAIADKTGTITLAIKNGSTLNAANVFEAQNGGSLDLTLTEASATGSDHSIYSNDGNVNLSASRSNLTGDMVQLGTGGITVELNDNSLFTGATTDVNSLTLNGDSVWQLTGTSNLKTLDNSGGIIKFATPTNGFSTLNVEGNYIGGGSIAFNAELGDDTSLTDKLVITGDTSGSTKVQVNNFGGTGGQTTNGIKLIEVQGTSSGEFKQDGRIVAGAYDYFLARGDAALGTDANNWYLTSKLGSNDAVRPEAGSYLGLIEYSKNAFNHSFHDRQQLLDNEYQSTWARIEYTKADSKAANGQLDNKTKSTLLHLGADIIQQDQLHIGLMAGYARGSIDSRSTLSDKTAKAHSDSYSVGMYGTWFDLDKETGGLYVDTYAQYNWFHNKVNGEGRAKESLHTNSYTFSAETGYGFTLGQTGNTTWLVEPQVQLLWNNYQGKNHTEKNGTRVNTRNSNDFISRFGVRFQVEVENLSPFITLNYWNNHSKNDVVLMNEEQVDSQRSRDLFEIKAGGQIHLNENIVLFTQINSHWGNNSTKAYGGNIGLKATW